MAKKIIKTDPKGGNVQDLTKSINSQLSSSSEQLPFPLIIQFAYLVHNDYHMFYSVKKKLRAKVTFDYTAQNDDELSLKVGDVIAIESQVLLDYCRVSANPCFCCIFERFRRKKDGGKERSTASEVSSRRILSTCWMTKPSSQFPVRKQIFFDTIPLIKHHLISS